MRLITWTFQTPTIYSETIKIVEGCGYFYNVRGLAWIRGLHVNSMRIHAARQLG